MNTITQMPDHARLWVYQSNRTFSESEKAIISNYLTSFVGQWAAHGNQLAAAFSIEHGQFIVLAVDETIHQASGCSIDASVGIIRNIENEFGVTLLDRSQVAFQLGQEILLIPFNQVKAAIAEGKISSDTITFNNAVSTAEEWKNQWQQKASDSWLKRHFN
ncbi:MAG: hypothetical protein JXR10_14380 [Cyclobacteriaceae bacterium]